MSWNVNGELFTGTIVTVGAGMDYNTLQEALAETTGDVLMLAYAGTYNAPISHDSGELNNRNIYVRGMEQSRNDVVIVRGLDDDLYTIMTLIDHSNVKIIFENVKVVCTANEAMFLDSSGNSNVDVTFSKADLDLSATPSETLFVFWDTPEPSAPYNIILRHISMTIPVSPGLSWFALFFGANNFGWDISGCQIDKALILGHETLSFEETIGAPSPCDYVPSPADGYGPDYGEFLILSDEPSDPVSITISPKTKYLKPGEAQQYTATAKYPNKMTVDITNDVTWSSSAPNVGRISGTGMAKSISPGRTSISAVYGDLSASALLTVSNVGSGNIGGKIVAFAALPNAYRLAEYQTKRFKFKPTSLSVIKVVANKYPVLIDIIYPAVPWTDTIVVTSSAARRIPARLTDTLDIRVRTNAQISGLFLASSMDELPL